MSTFSTILSEKQLTFMTPTTDFTHMSEIARLNKELDFLKNANPYRIAELNLELQIERIRVVEITKARDVALERLADAYVSIRQKNEFIELLQSERENKGAKPLPMQLSRPRDLADIEKLKGTIAHLHSTIQDLRTVMRELPQSPSSKPVDPPPCYEENVRKAMSVDIEVQTDPELIVQATSLGSGTPVEQGGLFTPPETDDPKELVKARHSVLAVIPLPSNPPDATLSAIIIPPPFTLHEFLSGAPPPLKNSLSSYRILQNITTTWCPEREEHGYMYTPAFKCSTNPRIATAHRWSAVDVLGRMTKPTECFYHKEGVWYYAGSYKAFKLDTLTPKEWAQLSPETISTIVKETISGRKNSSPQNTYETSQLYAAGALKVACVGLQCVGFNQDLYKAIIEHSIKFGETKWKANTATTAAASASGGIAAISPVGGPPAALTATTAASAASTKLAASRHVAAGHRAPSHVAPVGVAPAATTMANANGTPTGNVHAPTMTPVSGNGSTPLSSVSSSIWSMSPGGPGADLTSAANKLGAGADVASVNR